MNGMKMSEFMNKIYYGDEIEFTFDDTTYFVQGNQDGIKFILTVDYWKNTDGSEPPHDYIFSLECSSAEERLQKFAEAKIFNGKNIYEIESEVDVVYG